MERDEVCDEDIASPGRHLHTGHKQTRLIYAFTVLDWFLLNVALKMDAGSWSARLEQLTGQITDQLVLLLWTDVYNILAEDKVFISCATAQMAEWLVLPVTKASPANWVDASINSWSKLRFEPLTAKHHKLITVRKRQKPRNFSCTEFHSSIKSYWLNTLILCDKLF